MIRFTTGNLLEADVDAVVNTVNTVGVMGKGIALMFKEKFPSNFKAYARACEAGEVRTGEMFVTENLQLMGPRWIINFPTKQHWRGNTRLEWIESGLQDLVRVIRERGIRSIAIPPLGCGNGGLDWDDVRPLILAAFDDAPDVDAVVFEPTSKYQNVSKRKGVQKLTPARALVAEMVRRYSLLGIECSILEVQKLAWFLERGVERTSSADPFQFEFAANRYGPYSDKLRHLLDSLDGSYLICDKRLPDAEPADRIVFNDRMADTVRAYLASEDAKPFLPTLEWTTRLIEGFESPLGMELLATVDWLISREHVQADALAVLEALKTWPAGKDAATRKLRIFDARKVDIALDQLKHAA